MDRVLVAYGSKYGATAEIARRIGEVLERAGLAVDVKPADQVSDLAPYGAVVLGSAVYAGQWRKEAAQLLKAQEEALAARDVYGCSPAGPPARETRERFSRAGLSPSSCSLPSSASIRTRSRSSAAR